MKNSKNISQTIMALALLLFLGLACGGSYNEAVVADEVSMFESRFNEGKFVEIYKNSAKSLQEASSEREFVDLLSAISKKLGRMGEKKLVKWNVNYGPMETIVTYQYDSSFEKGKAVETFRFSVNKDSAKIVGYFINSTDLITR